MTFIYRALIAIALIVGFATLHSGTASAGDPQIEEAQRQGVIGERIDGYLGVVSGNVDPALLRKLNEINNKRRALYEQTAQRTGTTIAQVARVTGEKQVSNAAPGEYVMGADGVWVRK